MRRIRPELGQASQASQGARASQASKACSMAPLVEARADGRLDERERRSLERHIAACPTCTEIERGLQEVRELLRTPAGRPVTPLEHQRARLALLRAVSLGGTAPKPGAWSRLTSVLRSRGPRSVPALIAGAVAAVGVTGIALAATVAVTRAPEASSTRAVPRLASMSAIVRRTALASSQAPLSSQSSARRRAERTETRIASSEGARFERRSDEGVERIALEDGWIELEVRKLKPGERFIVVTKDAEVEVRGTIFDVEAHGGRMAHVNVREGKVELRRGGDVALIAEGDAWDVSEAPSVPSLPASSPSSPSEGRPVVALASGASSASGASGASGATPRSMDDVARWGSASKRSSAERASAEFDEAVKVLGRGDYGEARDRLDAFRIVHPDDARADLASFLSIVSLQRAGRREEARAAARRYLDLYPNGDRRAEAERLLNGLDGKASKTAPHGAPQPGGS